MDPLSIVASTVPLLEATGYITKSLTKFVKSYRRASSQITDLCDELSSLTSYLQAVDKTLKGCGALDFALVEDTLWREIDQALVNCQLSLADLCRLVEKIKSRSQTRGFAWKTRVVADLSIYDDELSAFRDKIYKSNSALQTILSTINVSLSLRSNTSQTKILSELNKLKASIEETLRVSQWPVPGLSHAFSPLSDTRIAHNLRHLADAARAFHSAATSTASTARADESSACTRRLSKAEFNSIAGDFPASKRERVEQFLRQSRRHPQQFHCTSYERSRSVSPRQNSTCRSRPVSALLTDLSDSSDHEDEKIESKDETGKSQVGSKEESEEEDDAELEREYLFGLLDLAVESIKVQDFGKAVDLLQKVLDSEEMLSETDDIEYASTLKTSDHKRSLRIQLAICHFLQGSWKLARPLVVDLARSKAGRDFVVCNLLQALAIAQLSEDETEQALASCRQAVLGKKRLCKKHEDNERWSEYHNALGLFHVIFNATNDHIRAEVFRRQIPGSFEYQHYSCPARFVAQNGCLLRALFELDDGSLPAPIILKTLEQPAKESADVGKSAVTKKKETWSSGRAQSMTNDADDEASLAPSTSRHRSSRNSMRRGITRMFSFVAPRRPISQETALSADSSDKPASTPGSRFTSYRTLSWRGMLRADKVASRKPPRSKSSLGDIRLLKGKESSGRHDFLRRMREKISTDDDVVEIIPMRNTAASPPVPAESPVTDHMSRAGSLATNTTGDPGVSGNTVPNGMTPELDSQASSSTSKETVTEHSSYEQSSNKISNITTDHQSISLQQDSEVPIDPVTTPSSEGFSIDHDLRRVASKLASLSSATDDDAAKTSSNLQALKLDLKSIFEDLEVISRDPMFTPDIQRQANHRTGSAATEPDHADDSGYSSAEPTCDVPSPCGLRNSYLWPLPPFTASFREGTKGSGAWSVGSHLSLSEFGRRRDSGVLPPSMQPMMMF